MSLAQSSEMYHRRLGDLIPEDAPSMSLAYLSEMYLIAAVFEFLVLAPRM